MMKEVGGGRGERGREEGRRQDITGERRRGASNGGAEQLERARHDSTIRQGSSASHVDHHAQACQQLHNSEGE